MRLEKVAFIIRNMVCMTFQSYCRVVTFRSTFEHLYLYNSCFELKISYTLWLEHIFGSNFTFLSFFLKKNSSHQNFLKRLSNSSIERHFKMNWFSIPISLDLKQCFAYKQVTTKSNDDTKYCGIILKKNLPA